MEHKQQAPKPVLPISVVTKVDLGRLIREIEALIEFMDQATIRQPGTQMQLPKSSRLMDDIVQANKVNLLQADHRRLLRQFLIETKKQAPVLHISFSADPTPHFLNRLMKHLRSSIHPTVLLQVGLQPNIGAGCVLRTTNKYFDFSLRHRFAQKHDMLMQALRATSVENVSNQKVAQ